MTSTLLRYALSIVLGCALAVTVLGVSSVVTPQFAGAQALDTEDLFGGDADEFGDSAGLGQQDLRTTIANLIRVVLGFLGIVAVVIVLYGGFTWMTAGGNDEKVGKAKRMLIAGVIGLAIILSAYAITTFVVSSILEASQ